MTGKAKPAYFLAVLLGIVFLAAQLHCCVDLNSRTIDSHVCPICSTAGTAIATPSLAMAMVLAINRLEVFGIAATLAVVILKNVAPRAPPAV
jgi:hypothetical protein